MIDVTLETSGFEETEFALAGFEAGITQVEQDALDAQVAPLKAAFAGYPPEMPGQKYQRTQNLAEQAYAEVTAIPGGAELQAGDTAYYEEFVRGNLNGYPGMYLMIGRWRSEQEINDQLVPVVTSHLLDMIDMLTARYFPGG